MSTPHIAAAPGGFSDVCLLPGGPRRARYGAERFLDDPTLVTSVRNIEGYTGLYRYRRVSVMGTGMAIPSTLICTTELIRECAVTTLIRVGSAGGIAEDLELRDIVIAVGTLTDSITIRARFGGFDFAAIPDFALTRLLVETAEERHTPVRVGAIISSDQCYHPQADSVALARKMGVPAAGMETAGLFGVATEHWVRAGAILTISDIIDGDDDLNPTEREQTLDEMLIIALEAASKVE